MYIYRVTQSNINSKTGEETQAIARHYTTRDIAEQMLRRYNYEPVGPDSWTAGEVPAEPLLGLNGAREMALVEEIYVSELATL
ncbi:MAG TPA: hypothetical protein PKD55_20195 [Bellilinea sp.]|nr:hypothetical protein [Bellilinea sp.]